MLEGRELHSFIVIGKKLFKLAEYLISLNCIEIDSTQEILICAKYHGNKNLSIL